MVKLVRPALWKLWIVHRCCSRVSPLKLKKYFNRFVSEHKLEPHSTILMYDKDCQVQLIEDAFFLGNILRVG